MLQPLPPAVFSLALAVPVIAFWIWMFSDMLRHDDVPGNKDYWTIAFIVLSLFTAAFYYINVYRKR